ncbi:MAG: PD40 domain-containing protein [Ktedonobacteraceae bacterium]|nr:PD40 domain-containing protein [Ktedonobacteraceae bacterium]MBV9712018.1 PD40 domain-containing protein [Ktedonobacteraceae bacterium]
MRKAPLLTLLFLFGICIVAGTSFSVHRWAHLQSDTPHISARADGPAITSQAYLYYVLKESQGFMVARAPEGSSHQPLSAPQPITLIGSGFGTSEADAVLSLQLSPDGRYLAIDGTRPDAEWVWVFDTQHRKINPLPSDAQGNFLRWLPSGHTFLYRPMFPVGPVPPAKVHDWRATIWQVDAASGSHKGIDLGVPSADLVDAAPSPDGSRIIYSTTAGLSLGSDTWLVNSNGSARKHLFKSNGLEAINALFSWSPNGKNIIYERLADSATPFLNAGLWLMNAQGTQSQRLADTDGGHGYTPSWSPDSRKVAFIVRTNPQDAQANIQSQSLQSAINVIDIASKKIYQIASPRETGMQLNTNPTWMADSAHVTFTALNPPNRVLGGTLHYWSVSATSSQVHPSAMMLGGPIAHVVAVS